MDNQKELAKWERMNSMGKRKYILKDGILYYGVPTGILWAIFYQLFEGGFSLDNFTVADFTSRLIIGLIVFSIVGIFVSLFTWNKLEKKYRKNM